MISPLAGLEGKYEIRRRLGRGGMGNIYLVRHVDLDELRVVKVMRADLAHDPELRRRFLREAKLASKFTHPNIVRVLDFSTDDDGRAFLVMEYVRGVTLEVAVQQATSLPMALKLRAAIQALEALDRLHSSKPRAIVHRDIAPDNLMLTEDHAGMPLVKLIDLGIAKTLQGEMRLTSTGAFLGKIRYASPEQLEGDAGEYQVGPQSDLYSFGIVLYELLTGRFPIYGSSQRSLLQGHLFKPPLSFDESDPGGHVPPALRALVLRALEKDPPQRIESARDFIDQLRQIEATVPKATREVTACLDRLLAGLPTEESDLQDGGTESVDLTQEILNEKFNRDAASGAGLAAIATTPANAKTPERVTAQWSGGATPAEDLELILGQIESTLDQTALDTSVARQLSELVSKHPESMRARDLMRRALGRLDERDQAYRQLNDEVDQLLAGGALQAAAHKLETAPSSVRNDPRLNPLRERVEARRHEVVGRIRGEIEAALSHEQLEVADQALGQLQAIDRSAAGTLAGQRDVVATRMAHRRAAIAKAGALLSQRKVDGAREVLAPWANHPEASAAVAALAALEQNLHDDAVAEAVGRIEDLIRRGELHAALLVGQRLAPEIQADARVRAATADAEAARTRARQHAKQRAERALATGNAAVASAAIDDLEVLDPADTATVELGRQLAQLRSRLEQQQAAIDHAGKLLQQATGASREALEAACADLAAVDRAEASTLRAALTAELQRRRAESTVADLEGLLGRGQLDVVLGRLAEVAPEVRAASSFQRLEGNVHRLLEAEATADRQNLADATAILDLEAAMAAVERLARRQQDRDSDHEAVRVAQTARDRVAQLLGAARQHLDAGQPDLAASQLSTLPQTLPAHLEAVAHQLRSAVDGALADQARGAAVRELARSARQALARRDFGGARALLGQVHATDPNSGEVNTLAAEIAAGEGEAEAAEAAERRAQQQRATAQTLELARVALERGDLDAARRARADLSKLDTAAASVLAQEIAAADEAARRREEAHQRAEALRAKFDHALAIGRLTDAEHLLADLASRAEAGDLGPLRQALATATANAAEAAALARVGAALERQAWDEAERALAGLRELVAPNSRELVALSQQLAEGRASQLQRAALSEAEQALGRRDPGAASQALKAARQVGVPPTALTRLEEQQQLLARELEKVASLAASARQNPRGTLPKIEAAIAASTAGVAPELAALHARVQLEVRRGDAETLVERATGALTQGDINTALTLGRQALELAPDSARASQVLEQAHALTRQQHEFAARVAQAEQTFESARAAGDFSRARAILTALDEQTANRVGRPQRLAALDQAEGADARERLERSLAANDLRTARNSRLVLQRLGQDTRRWDAGVEALEAASRKRTLRLVGAAVAAALVVLLGAYLLTRPTPIPGPGHLEVTTTGGWVEVLSVTGSNGTNVDLVSGDSPMLLEGLPQGDYTVRWRDPRNGQENTATVAVGADSVFEIPSSTLSPAEVLDDAGW